MPYRAIAACACFFVSLSASAAPRGAGFLLYEVRDATTGAAIPCKLTFVGVRGTETPRFTANDIGRQEGKAVAAFNRLMSSNGVGEIALPRGTYDVYVSRGPEWDVFVGRGIRINDKDVVLRAKLSHVVDTKGWISADFHVHASASHDSQVPMQDRIYEFVADGVEMIVSTDHNVVTDYAPIIQELGLARYLASAPGDELTTNGWGHFGAFPLTRDLERAGQGAVLVHGRTASDFFADVRRVAPLAVIDVHHPRIDAEIGYFNLGRFDAQSDRAERAGFSYDFDALEVLNGYQDAERKHIERVIEDWFALLDHGHIVTATGNSDTHHLDHNIGGYPRNYVQVDDDDPAALPADAVPRALRAHRSFFTTAPFVRVHVGDASIGEVARVKSGRARADIEVQAAPWVTVSSVSVYLDGKLLQRIPVPASTAPLRIKTAVELEIKRDAYLVVRVDGDKPMAPIVGDLTRFDVRPLALTNPIFLDFDGNGRFDAPHAHPLPHR